jgi:hypothetical protein
MQITKAALKKKLNSLNIPVTPDGYVRAKHVKWALRRFAKADIVPKYDLEKAQNLTPEVKRDTLKMVYHTILKGLGRENEMAVFERAIKMIPEREVDQEWRAVMDGTVSKIVKTMMKGDLTPEEIEELGAIYEGLAKPYFRDYQGDVPAEDLEWAHNQIKEYFDKVADKQDVAIEDDGRNTRRRIG